MQPRTDNESRRWRRRENERREKLLDFYIRGAVGNDEMKQKTARISWAEMRYETGISAGRISRRFGDKKNLRGWRVCVWRSTNKSITIRGNPIESLEWECGLLKFFLNIFYPSSLLVRRKFFFIQSYVENIDFLSSWKNCIIEKTKILKFSFFTLKELIEFFEEEKSISFWGNKKRCTTVWQNSYYF